MVNHRLNARLMLRWKLGCFHIGSVQLFFIIIIFNLSLVHLPPLCDAFKRERTWSSSKQTLTHFNCSDQVSQAQIDLTEESESRVYFRSLAAFFGKCKLWKGANEEHIETNNRVSEM